MLAEPDLPPCPLPALPWLSTLPRLLLPPLPPVTMAVARELSPLLLWPLWWWWLDWWWW